MSLLTCYRREEYTDENSEGRGEIDLHLVIRWSRQDIHVFRIVAVRDKLTLLLETVPYVLYIAENKEYIPFLCYAVYFYIIYIILFFSII